MAQGTTGALNPNGWGTTVGTSPITVLPPNPSRQGLIFTNQSTVQIAICPAVVNVGAFGVYAGFQQGVPGIGQPGSITMNQGDKFIIDNLNCTGGWNAVASAAGGVLTILES